MKFEEAGTYTLDYTAVDGCGNETTATRTVIVGTSASSSQNENSSDTEEN